MQKGGEKVGEEVVRNCGQIRPNDAYIKISKAEIKTGFFEPKESIQVQIDVIWDEGAVMICLEEGNQESNHLLYPKK